MITNGRRGATARTAESRSPRGPRKKIVGPGFRSPPRSPPDRPFAPRALGSSSRATAVTWDTSQGREAHRSGPGGILGRAGTRAGTAQRNACGMGPGSLRGAGSGTRRDRAGISRRKQLRAVRHRSLPSWGPVPNGAGCGPRRGGAGAGAAGPVVGAPAVGGGSVSTDPSRSCAETFTAGWWILRKRTGNMPGEMSFRALGCWSFRATPGWCAAGDDPASRGSRRGGSGFGAAASPQVSQLR